MAALRSFWRYYGAKWRAAKLYPAPRYSVIAEPFAGAAGYSLHYPDREVVLFDVNPRIVGTWDYIIRAPEHEIAAIPDCRNVADLPSWVPQEGRWLVGWWLNNGTTEPRNVQSVGRLRKELSGRKLEYWNRAVVERITSQQRHVRHWTIYNTRFDALPNAPITWLVDPPYANRAGSYYTFSDIDYTRLGAWCREREGQVIVCENEGATWLPFERLATVKAGWGRTSAEVVWIREAA